MKHTVYISSAVVLHIDVTVVTTGSRQFSSSTTKCFTPEYPGNFPECTKTKEEKGSGRIGIEERWNGNSRTTSIRETANVVHMYDSG